MNQPALLFHHKQLIHLVQTVNHVSLGNNRSGESLAWAIRYRQALMNNLLLQTSCYWGQRLTDYAPTNEGKRCFRQAVKTVGNNELAIARTASTDYA